MKKWFRSSVFLLLVLLAAAFIMPQSQDVQAATPRLNKTKVTLSKGGQVKLRVTGTKKKPKWSTDKKKVAMVTSKGLVKAKGKGAARITAKVGKKKLVCRVTVEVPKLNKTRLTVTAGKTATLKLTGTTGKVKWYTTDPNVATVTQKGVVRGVRAGSCRVYAKVNGGTFYCSVSVKAAPQATPTPTTAPIQTPTPEPKLELSLLSEYQKVKVNRDNTLEESCRVSVSSVYLNGAEITSGFIFKIIPSIEIEGSWDSSSRSYIVRRLKGDSGYVDVMVEYDHRILSEPKRFVVEKDPDYVQVIPVESFRLDQEMLHVFEGESASLTYSIFPEYATDKAVQFSSSDEQVATVSSDGVVTGKVPGECTVSAVCGGIESICKVVINKKFVVEDAERELTYESFVVDNPKDGGIIVIARNNYKYAMSIDAKCKFYDNSGNLIGDSGTLLGENHCLEPGRESFFYIRGPYKPSRYEVYFKIRESDYEGKIGGIKILSSNSEFRPDFFSTVSANIKNEAGINSYTGVACIFYKNGVPVWFDNAYAHVEYIGAEDEVNLYCNTWDLDGRWIEPDEYKSNIQYSYK